MRKFANTFFKSSLSLVLFSMKIDKLNLKAQTSKLVQREIIL